MKATQDQSYLTGVLTLYVEHRAGKGDGCVRELDLRQALKGIADIFCYMGDLDCIFWDVARRHPVTVLLERDSAK